LEKRGWGRFYYKNKAFIINDFVFYEIPLYPPFPKGEVKSRILSQSLSLIHPTKAKYLNLMALHT